MTKTEQEIERDIYSLVCADALALAVNGAVYRRSMRPYNSQSEDIVVRFLSGQDEQIQTGVVILNIYVPDLQMPDGRSVPDLTRLAELQRLALDFIGRTRQSEYRLTTDNTPTTLESPEIHQHYINVRLRFKRLSD